MNDLCLSLGIQGELFGRFMADCTKDLYSTYILCCGRNSTDTSLSEVCMVWDKDHTSSGGSLPTHPGKRRQGCSLA